MRSVARVLGISVTTVVKLLVDAGEACAAFHDEYVRDLTVRRVEADEIWTFCYAKKRNAPAGIDAGDLWTWTAIDSDTKLIISWLVSLGQSPEDAVAFMKDLRGRLANRVQLDTDGNRFYLEAVEHVFGANVDYAQLVKVERVSEEAVSTYRRSLIGSPDLDELSTSYVERHNLTMRMSLKRYTRRTNAFSKKVENHGHALALYTTWYNWVRPHQSLGRYATTPAMAAGLTSSLHGMEWLVELIDSREVQTPGHPKNGLTL